VNAPTGINTSTLVPSTDASVQLQALAAVIRRASSWADQICFGADVSANGASLAASLVVESVNTRIKNGNLRLVCDYRPIVQVVGIAVGPYPGSVAPISPTQAQQVRISRRTITVPWMPSYLAGRPDDSIGFIPVGTAGSVYAVWSYVAGYPHTQLVANATAGTTTIQVASTDGQGGVWGLFPGTQLTIVDGGDTEQVTVLASPTAVSNTVAELTVTPLLNAHTVPSAPDFLPVTALPPAVHQAVISLTSVLIKTRGTRALTMPEIPGTRPSSQMLAQAGALEDYKIAEKLLENYRVRVRIKQ